MCVCVCFGLIDDPPRRKILDFFKNYQCRKQQQESYCNGNQSYKVLFVYTYIASVLMQYTLVNENETCFMLQQHRLRDLLCCVDSSSSIHFSAELLHRWNRNSRNLRFLNPLAEVQVGKCVHKCDQSSASIENLLSISGV